VKGAQVGVGVAALITRVVDGEMSLLMLQRGALVTHGAREWSVPGGWVDYGETPHRAVVREVFEETGIHVVPSSRPVGVTSHVFRQERIHSVCLWFRAEQIGTDLIQNLEPEKADAVEWVPLHAAGGRDLFGHAEAFLSEYGAFA
jgi:8-oxo-dGTP diphosphatase